MITQNGEMGTINFESNINHNERRENSGLIMQVNLTINNDAKKANTENRMIKTLGIKE